MPRVPPVPESQIERSLAETIKQSHQSGVLSSTLPARIWAHRPEVAKAWIEAINSFYANSLISDRTRELLRLKIASITRCEACQLARKSDDVSEVDVACLVGSDDHFAPDEQAALEFAERFANDYTMISHSDFDKLEKYFSLGAIVEIQLFCGLMLAGGRVTYVMDAYESQ